MTTLELSGFVQETSAPQPKAGTAWRFWHEIVRRHRERQTVVRLSRLGPHLIRDMGFDPERIQAAVDGTWDEDPTHRFPIV